jgi:hypothetical protein
MYLEGPAGWSVRFLAGRIKFAFWGEISWAKLLLIISGAGTAIVTVIKLIRMIFGW